MIQLGLNGVNVSGSGGYLKMIKADVTTTIDVTVDGVLTSLDVTVANAIKGMVGYNELPKSDESIVIPLNIRFENSLIVSKGIVDYELDD